MLRNNADACWCSYFELGLPVISLAIIILPNEGDVLQSTPTPEKLCFCFPTNMLHLKAPFFPTKLLGFPQKVRQQHSPYYCINSSKHEQSNKC